MITDRPILTLLRLEGLAAFIAGLVLYGTHGGSWLLLLPLLLLPDVSMVGYLRDPRLGALLYNLAHNWALGVACSGSGSCPGRPGWSSPGPSSSRTSGWTEPWAMA
jgi:hypothetical protein